MIDIREQIIVGKRPDQTLCEDGLYTDDNFVAVIDGVTSKGVRKWQSHYSSGGYAKEVIIKTIKTMPRDITMPDFFMALDNALKQEYDKAGGTDDITEWLRACVAVYSDFHKQIWIIGDCACMINGKLFDTAKKVDTIISELRSFIICKYLKDGYTEEDIAKNDVAREAVMPFINMQLDFENDFRSPYGYTVLNGHGVDVSQVQVYDVIRGDTVILASDGYPKLFDTLERSEAELKRVLEIDSLCYKLYPGTKGLSFENSSFDDRTYIKFTVS